jgi:hypothetical protein
MEDQKYQTRTCSICGTLIEEDMPGVVFHSKDIEYACCEKCVSKVENEVMSDETI